MLLSSGDGSSIPAHENGVNYENGRRRELFVTTAELLLHPVRLRVVQAFLGDRQLTTADLRRTLPDVPGATLYRHVATLASAGVIEVAGERQVRGALERTYRLRVDRASVDPEDLRSLGAEEHRAAFTAFVAALLAQFDAYVDAGPVDFDRDVAGYRQAGFFATPDEARALADAVRAAVAPFLAARPGPGRRRRLLTTVLLPAEEGSATP